MKVRGDFLGPPRSTDKTTLIIKVSKGAKIRNRYNQVPHLTQATKTHLKMMSAKFVCCIFNTNIPCTWKTQFEHEGSIYVCGCLLHTLLFLYSRNLLN